MNMHLTDEDLILHFYGDEPSREADVDAHLQRCADCQQQWNEIRETLKLVDIAGMPEPNKGFERVMWAKVQRALPESAAPARHRFSFFPGASWRSVQLSAAAVLVAVVVGGYFWRHTPGTTTTMAPEGQATRTAVADTRSRERVLLTALDDHFQQSEMLLVEVLNMPERASFELGFERQTADDLLGSSRLYRVTAQQNGDVRLSQMLEDLEAVLVEIARSPERVPRREFDSLRARIEEDNLLFKVRAVSKQIHDRQRSLSTE